MKRGTLEHPKLRRLARLLQVEPWGAAGILESLWHWTARYARRGDVGRYSDDEIAEGIGWRARPAGELIHALIEARWLDRSLDHRLVVHDVADHADEAWRKSLARSPEGKGSFIKSIPCACPDSVQTASGQRLDYPEPEPEPVPEPVLILGSPSPSRFAEYWQVYPKKRHRPAAERAWKRLEADRIADAIIAGVVCWQGSEQWRAGRIEDPATFLNQRQWEDPVPAPPQERERDDSPAAIAARIIAKRGGL